MLETLVVLVLAAGGGEVDDDVNALLLAQRTGLFHSLGELLEAHGLVADLHDAVHFLVLTDMDMGNGSAQLCAGNDLLCQLIGGVGNGGCLILLGAGAAEAYLNHDLIGFSHGNYILSSLSISVVVAQSHISMTVA